MKATVVQPSYFAPGKPDETIANFLLEQMKTVEPGDLILLPEYCNAGGISDPELELQALPRAGEMKRRAAEMAKDKRAFVAVNVLESRDGKLKNSTYLYGTQGQTLFVYDKIHLPPAEVKLGVERGPGACFWEAEGIRFGFMTCYDVYFNEQIEYLAKCKPDIILVPGYQRGERTDIIRAQGKLLAFRCNAYVVRASYSMGSDDRGGCSMIVSPAGEILVDAGKDTGSFTAQIQPKEKYMRTAGFGGGMVRNDDFINDGLCQSVFK